MQPTISYIICATPRSGSTLLCEALTSTGVAGRPKEYFSGNGSLWVDRLFLRNHADQSPINNSHFAHYDGKTIWEGVCAGLSEDQSEREHKIASFEKLVQLHHQDPSVIEKYLVACIEQCTMPNGVYGAKTMWHHFHYLTCVIKQLPSCKALPVSEGMKAIFPHLRYIWVKRRNRVRQAVSHAKSLQTRVWHVTADSSPQWKRELTFSFQLIDLIMHRLEVEEAMWEKFFNKHHIKPLVVIYEDFAAHYEERTLQIVKELGIPAEQIAFEPRSLQRMADELSEQWVEHYRSLITHSIWHRCLSYLNRLLVPWILICLRSPTLRAGITRAYVRLVRMIHGHATNC